MTYLELHAVGRHCTLTTWEVVQAAVAVEVTSAQVRSTTYEQFTARFKPEFLHILLQITALNDFINQ